MSLLIALVVPIPHPVRRRFFFFLTQGPLSTAILKIHTGFVFLSFCFLLESLRQLSEFKKEMDYMDENDSFAQTNEFQDQRLNLKVFYAERTFYLAIATLFVSVGLNRWLALLRSVTRVEDRIKKIVSSKPQEEIMQVLKNHKY